MELCSRCNTRPIHIIKRKLCGPCYQLLRKNNPEDTKPKMITASRSARQLDQTLICSDGCFMGFREIDFIKNFFTHTNWMPKPALFRLTDDIKYAPDFYDGERNVFIEVAGTRQAYHQNKDKYELMRKIYPKIAFEIRRNDGGLLNMDANERLQWGRDSDEDPPSLFADAD